MGRISDEKQERVCFLKGRPRSIRRDGNGSIHGGGGPCFFPAGLRSPKIPPILECVSPTLLVIRSSAPLLARSMGRRITQGAVHQLRPRRPRRAMKRYFRNTVRGNGVWNYLMILTGSFPVELYPINRGSEPRQGRHIKWTGTTSNSHDPRIWRSFRFRNMIHDIGLIIFAFTGELAAGVRLLVM